MSFADLLNEAMPSLHTHRGKTRCRVGDILADLDNEDAKAATLAIENANYPAARITQALRNGGYGVSDTTMKRHRRHLCSCYPAGVDR